MSSPGSSQTAAPAGDLGGQLPAGVRVFMARQSAGAMVLLAATLTALVWANSPWGDSYAQFWHTPLTITLGGAALDLDLDHWVNNGRMVFFFFVLGLEVKREIVVGELADRRRAAVPAAAALAGLVVPALVFFAFNPSGPAAAARSYAIAKRRVASCSRGRPSSSSAACEVSYDARRSACSARWVASTAASRSGSRSSAKASLSSSGMRTTSGPGSACSQAANVERPATMIKYGRASRAPACPGATSPASAIAVNSRYTWLRVTVQKSPSSDAARAASAYPVVGLVLGRERG